MLIKYEGGALYYLQVTPPTSGPQVGGDIGENKMSVIVWITPVIISAFKRTITDGILKKCFLTDILHKIIVKFVFELLDSLM